MQPLLLEIHGAPQPDLWINTNKGLTKFSFDSWTHGYFSDEDSQGDCDLLIRLDCDENWDPIWQHWEIEEFITDQKLTINDIERNGTPKKGSCFNWVVQHLNYNHFSKNITHLDVDVYIHDSNETKLVIDIGKVLKHSNPEVWDLVLSLLQKEMGPDFICNRPIKSDVARPRELPNQ